MGINPVDSLLVSQKTAFQVVKSALLEETVDNNGYEDAQPGKDNKPMSQENPDMEEESADEAEEDAPSPPGPAEKIIIVLVVLALITCSTGLAIWGTIAVFDKDFGSGRK